MIRIKSKPKYLCSILSLVCCMAAMSSCEDSSQPQQHDADSEVRSLLTQVSGNEAEADRLRQRVDLLEAENKALRVLQAQPDQYNDGQQTNGNESESEAPEVSEDGTLNKDSAFDISRSGPEITDDSSEPSEFTIQIDRSAYAQRERKKLLNEFWSYGIIRDQKYRPGGTPKLVVTDAFSALDYENKESLASLFYAYCATEYDGFGDRFGDRISVIHRRTHEELASFGFDGFQLQ